MKINEKMISIPPYLSTSWNNVAAIHMKGNVLVISLIDGDTITVPGLNNKIIDEVFNFHSRYLDEYEEAGEMELNKNSSQEKIFSDSIIEFPFRLGIGGIDGIGANLLQHNSSQAHSPDLPSDFLQKITTVAKAVAGEDIFSFLKAEPHCNCPHCQIARSLDGEVKAKEEKKEDTFNLDEEVKDEELEFQQWDIFQTGDQLYNVINRVDSKEKYNVFLGKPMGCTCGKEGCDHIVAVLKAPLS